MSEEPLTRAWIDMSDEGMQQYVQTGSVEVGPDQDQEPAMPEVHNAESGADEAQQRAAEESSHAGDGIPVQPMQLVGVPILEPDRVVIDSEEFSASSTLNELRRAARKLGLSAGGSKSKVWSRLVEFEMKQQREAVEHVAAEQLAKQPRAVSQPKEPSERQRQIHELTH